MAKRFKIANGVAAIYDTANGDAPLTSPLTNLSLLKFHSSLPVPQTIDVRSFTLSLPARSNFQQAVGSYTLFAHGRAGYPFVMGDVTVGGQKVGFSGSVPVQMGSVGFYGRWLSLGADATNVIVHEYCVAAWTSSVSFETYPAISIPITVYVTDEILE